MRKEKRRRAGYDLYSSSELCCASLPIHGAHLRSILSAGGEQARDKERREWAAAFPAVFSCHLASEGFQMINLESFGIQRLL